MGLNDDQSNSADSEILYAMYCLQSLGDAINNIAKLIGKNATDLSVLRSTLEEKVFSKYSIDIKDFIEVNKKGIPGAAQVAPAIKPVSVPVKESKQDVMKQLIEKRISMGEKPYIPSSEINNSGKALEIAPEIHPVPELARYGTSPSLPTPTPTQQTPPKTAAPTPTPATPPPPISIKQYVTGIESKPQTFEPTIIINKESKEAVIKPMQPAPTPTASVGAEKVSLPDYRYGGGKDPYREQT